MAQHEPSRVRPPKKRLATDGTNYTSRRRNEPVQEVEMEEVDEPSDFPMWKTVAVIVVIFACFAILYPKMFHPMLLYALGMGKSEDIGNKPS